MKIGEVYNTTYGWELSPDRAKVIFAADQGPGLLISTETGAVEEAAFRTSAACPAGSGSRPERTHCHTGGPAEGPPALAYVPPTNSLTFVPYPGRATSVSP